MSLEYYGTSHNVNSLMPFRDYTDYRFKVLQAIRSIYVSVPTYAGFFSSTVTGYQKKSRTIIEDISTVTWGNHDISTGEPKIADVSTQFANHVRLAHKEGLLDEIRRYLGVLGVTHTVKLREEPGCNSAMPTVRIRMYNTPELTQLVARLMGSTVLPQIQNTFETAMTLYDGRHANGDFYSVTELFPTVLQKTLEMGEERYLTTRKVHIPPDYRQD